MPTEQEVIVRTEDGKDYPATLFDGRLDVDALQEQLAQEGLVLTKLDGKFPGRDGNGLSRTVFKEDIIKGQTTRSPGEAISCFLQYTHIDMPCNAFQSQVGSTVCGNCVVIASVYNVSCNMSIRLLLACRVEVYKCISFC